MMTQPPYGDPGGPWQTPPPSVPPSHPEPPPVSPVSPMSPVSPLPAPATGWPGPDPYPPYPADPPKRRRGLIIVLVILVVVVVLGGGGAGAAYFLTRGQDGIGRPTPQAAVEDFLHAVYVDQNATKAAALTCHDARDPKKIAAKIDEISQQNKQYDAPRYTWGTPSTDQPGQDRAVLSTTVTLNTANSQQATQKLKFIVVHSEGWFVCDVQKTG
jgi:flagellar basal body-associated protein FliL